MSIVSGTVGGIMGSSSAGKAADVQMKLGLLSMQAQMNMFSVAMKKMKEQEERLQPWVEAGQYGIEQAMGMIQDQKPFVYEESPEYQWQLEQGKRMVEGSAAARGGGLGGKYGKDLLRFSQGLATQDYTNAMNRFYNQRNQELNPYFKLAGMGEFGTSQTGANTQGMVQSALGTGESVAQTLLGMGTALGNSAYAQGQAWAGMGQAAGSGLGYLGGSALSGMFSSGGNTYNTYSGPGYDYNTPDLDYGSFGGV